MNVQEPFEALKACLLPADEAQSIPPAFYASPELAKAEEGRIFRSGWVGIGRADRWRNPGDYTAMDIGGVPVVVLRGKDGQLNAFANSCRHRGARLLR